MSAHMMDSLGKPTKKNNGKTTTVIALTAEQKAKKEALATKATTTRKLKALIDKINNELSSTKASLSSLLSKGYPQAMVDWCEKKLSDFAATVDSTNIIYIDAVSVTDSESHTTADIAAKSKKLDEVTNPII